MDVNADNGIYPHHLYMKLDALETELKGWWCDGFYHIEGKPLDLHTEKLEAQIIVTKDGIRDIENGLYARVCSHCGHGMNEGYVWGDGEGYACSDLCLYGGVQRGRVCEYISDNSVHGDGGSCFCIYH